MFVRATGIVALMLIFSIAAGRKGTADIHEDVGFLSYDKGKIVPGFRESAGGMRVRMSLEFLSEREYGMVLELASKGKELSPCQKMRMQKVKQGTKDDSQR